MSRDDYLSGLRDDNAWVVWGYRCRECDRVLNADADACPHCGEDPTKPPLAAYGGAKHARSNDPTTWRSYEQAVEYHERDDTATEGVGYMLSEQGLVVGVDLDGCRHPETGELEPWAEEIVERLDTYTEVSPSGTGLRLFVLGFLPEGRRKQKQERTLDVPEWVEEQKNAEVEVYETTRYMTYTGDHLEGTPTTAEQRGSAIREIHAEFVADDDADQETSTATTSTSAGAGEEIDVDEDDLDDDADREFTNELGMSLADVREMDDKLDALLEDLEPNYPLPNDDDSASGYDLATASKLHFWRFDKADIVAIIRQHRSRPKTRQRLAYVKDTVANAADPTADQYTPGAGPDDVDGPEEAAKALEAALERYEDTDSDPDPKTERRLYKLLSVVDDEDLDPLTGRVAEVAGETKAAVERHREYARHKAEHGPILVDSGKTWYLSGQPLRRRELLNFELGVKALLETPDGSRQAEVELRPPDSDGLEKTIPPRVFKKRQRWEDDVLADQFGLTMTIPDGVGHPEDLLDDLNRWVRKQDAPLLTGTRHLGLHGSEFVLPDGVLGADEWLDSPETVYLEREIDAERRVRLSPSDGSDYDERDVRAILRDLPYTRDVGRFLPALGWYYAASFRSWVAEWEGEFNLLSVTGGTGSGKTTTLGYLSRCFGLDAEPGSVDTYFATLSSLASTNALPVWFDEYKPSDMSSRKTDYFHRLLRKTTRGAKEQRGKPDGSTTTYTLASPVVVSGEQKIQGSAERRRSIMTTFRQDVTDTGTETRETYKRLAGQATVEEGELQLPEDAPDPTSHALAWFRWVARRDRGEVREVWHEAREFVARARSEWDDERSLDELEIQGLQTVVFGWRLYRWFAGDHDVRLAALPDEDDVRDALANVADAVAPSGARKNHEDRFVELLARAASAGYVSSAAADGPDHYDYSKAGTFDEELRFNISRCYDAVSKYVRDHDLDDVDLLGLDDYRERFKDRADEDGHYVARYSHPTARVGRAVCLKTVQLIDALDVDPTSFARPCAVCADVEADDSDDGGDGAGDDTGARTGDTAATDGSGAGLEDHEGAQADLDHITRAMRHSAVTRPEDAWSVGTVCAHAQIPDGDRVEALLEHGRERGLFGDTDEGGYYLVD